MARTQRLCHSASMAATIGAVLKPGVSEARDALAKAQQVLPNARFLVEATGHHAVAGVPGVEIVDASVIEAQSDLVVVFGGDGTLIHAASLLQNRAVPILGVNMGNIGFLTDATRAELASLLEPALQGRLPHCDRMRLDVMVTERDEVVMSGRVLNDVVLSQKALARIATYRVEYDGDLVTTLRADGVIVATPTGSTAYSMAAGGSILAPGLDAVAITPICPHGLTQRPLVVSPAGVIELRVQSQSTVFATLDGQWGAEVPDTGCVVVRKAPVGCRLLSVPEQTFFKTLRTKLRWGEATTHEGR